MTAQAMPTPADYPHHELYISDDADAAVRTVVIPRGVKPTMLTVELLRDAIQGQLHVLFAAEALADLALATLLFRRLVAERRAPRTVH